MSKPPTSRVDIEAVLHDYEARGMRCIAFAYHAPPEEKCQVCSTRPTCETSQKGATSGNAEADNKNTSRFLGLTPVKVEASRAEHGDNVITPPPPKPWWKLFREKFDDPVIRILMIAAIIALTAGIFEGKYAEAIGIIAAIFLATFLAFYNEFKAQKEFKLLERTSDDDPITVIRDGNPTQVPKRDLVVGDVVLIEKGQELPADGRVLVAVSLQANEAPLTGESYWADKVATEEIDPTKAAETTYPPDMVHRGTEVMEGRGTIELTAVGKETEIGKMASEEKLQFTVDPTFQSDLDNNRISTDLREEFEKQRHPLPENVVISTKENDLRWVITDQGHGRKYTVKKEKNKKGENKLNIYYQETKPETPLNNQLKRLSDLIGVLAFLIAGLLFAALIGRGVITGELNLTPQQWDFTAILFVSVSVALVRVWLPIVYNGLELLGKESKPPAWMGLDDDDENDDEGDGQASLDELFKWLKTIGAAAVIFAIGWGIGHVTGFIPHSPAEWLPKAASEEFLKYFMIAVTLIVVAVPEGLAMSVTLSLAYSARKLMADNNLVKRMHACETIGAATIICSDKTGTLTKNEMQVRNIEFPCLDGKTRLSSAGSLNDYEMLIIEAISANTTSELNRETPGSPRAVGNPTEGALLLWLDSQGVSYKPHREGFRVIRQELFDNNLKYMGTLGISLTTCGRTLYVKGAPEIVLDHCTEVLTPEGVKTLDNSHFLPDKGWVSGTHLECLPPKQLTRPMTWLGFVAIEDPVRGEVPAAIQACRDAGIDVKIITGDNPRTAIEVARQIGLWTDGAGADECWTGDNFRSLSDVEARGISARLKVLARAKPKDKERLVRLLQKDGHVVAVTGDGVNDVAALLQAQVGLAMGIRGTDAAKGSSDIVIKDDSFTSVATGVKWGRSLYQNIQRFILFQLTINVAACGIALLGPFIGVKLPLTVTQMLWVNLIMDTFAALALATEPPHGEVMQRPPRDPNEFIITKPMTRNIFPVGFTFLIFLAGFLLYIQQDSRVTAYELSTFFTTFVMLQFWNLFNARCLGLNQSAFSRLRENPWFVVIAIAIFIGQILFVQVGGEVFRTVPLSLRDWIVIVAGTSVVLWVGELWRLVVRLRAR